MFTLVITLHVLVCVLLIAIILVQAGRGSGLVESLSGVESMFGTKTSAFLTRITAVLSTLFFITCVSLAFLSLRQSRSLMRSVKPQAQATEPTTLLSGQDKKEAVPEQAISQNATTAVPQAEPAPAAPVEKKTGEVPKTE